MNRYPPLIRPVATSTGTLSGRQRLMTSSGVPWIPKLTDSPDPSRAGLTAFGPLIGPIPRRYSLIDYESSASIQRTISFVAGSRGVKVRVSKYWGDQPKHPCCAKARQPAHLPPPAIGRSPIPCGGPSSPASLTCGDQAGRTDQELGIVFGRDAGRLNCREIARPSGRHKGGSAPRPNALTVCQGGYRPQAEPFVR